MFGSQVLDVGIGLVMLFAFMSLIASALSEAIEAIVNVRAKQLEQGIRSLLDDPTGKKITEQFFNHPLISILFPGSYSASLLTPPGKGDSEKSPNPNSARVSSMPWRIRADLPAYIPSANFALAVLSLAAKGVPTDGQTLRNGVVENLKTCPQLQKIVEHALAAGGDDLGKAQAFLENWYNSAMDQVTTWYKQNSQRNLFVIGLAAAIFLNVDAITVTGALMSETALRQAVVNHASSARDDSTANLKDSVKALDSLGYPIGWTNLPQLRAAEKASGAEPPAAGAPVGCEPSACFDDLLKRSNKGQILLSMAFGWLITALAVMLGAPFWFDLLSKFVQIRSATKPPTEEPAKKSKSADAN